MKQPLDRILTDLPAELAAEQLVDRLGIEIKEWSQDRVVATMPVAGNRQPFGLLHGGASAALAETLGSLAATAYVAPDGMLVGIELNCTHHRAAREGLVTGVCEPLYHGTQVGTYQVTITDEADRLICTARLTCLLRKSGGTDQ
ncbi:hotdog fold thioesterase [Streptomyces sp. NPDC029004]|uniref:hotdog fold thioesterase n=1 Tax=Streptomyces sp. NPDC029004 TaxID=3154490 RepID=UPI0033F11113